MNILNAFEVGCTLTQIGVFEYPTGGAGGSALTLPQVETAVATIGPAPQGIEIGSVTINPSAAVTASDTNYCTISIFKRTAGGAGVLLASGSTSITLANPTGNWVAWVPVSLTRVAGAFVSANDVITISITKTGTGALPQFVLTGYTTVR